MGSNNWLKIASATALAVSMLGPISAAQAQFDGVKGHIDIPEIARTRGGKTVSNPNDAFAGISDEFGDTLIGTPIGVTPDDRIPEPATGGSNDPGQVQTLSRLFVTAPQSVANPVGLDTDVRAVPGSGVLAPLALLTLAGRRRRSA